MKKTQMKELVEQRRRQFEAMNEWEREHPQRFDAATAIAKANELYLMLPEEARRREPNVEGVRIMHAALAGLGARER